MLLSLRHSGIRKEVRQATPLEDEVAIVTRSFRDIRKTIALELAWDGASVIVCARTEQATEGSPGSIGETATSITAERESAGIESWSA